MARPKKVKPEDIEAAAEQLDKKPIPMTERMRYCPKCNGILFGGQIIHRKDCSG